MSNLPTEQRIEELAEEGVYKRPYWCVGKTQKACAAAKNKHEARKLFYRVTGEYAVKCNPLPYGPPYSRILNVVIYPDGSRSTHGYFCFSPDECAGYSSCPQRRACSE